MRLQDFTDVFDHARAALGGRNLDLAMKILRKIQSQPFHFRLGLSTTIFHPIVGILFFTLLLTWCAKADFLGAHIEFSRVT